MSISLHFDYFQKKNTHVNKLNLYEGRKGEEDSAGFFPKPDS